MRQTAVRMGLLALTLLPLATAAQPTEGPRPDSSRRDRARTFLVLRIVDALNLNDQEALKVSTIVRQSDERRQQLLQQRETLEQQIRAALSKKPADAVALSKLISEGNDVDQRVALIPEDTFRELQKVLTVEQQANLVLLRRELQGEIRRAMRGRRLGGAPRTKQADDD